MTIVLLSAGGFFGAICRAFVSMKLNRQHTPYGTLLVNLLGSFLLGFVLSLGVNGYLYAFAALGFLGAFTTFSTFYVEIVKLMMKRRTGRAIAYLFLTYAAGVLFAALGFFTGNSF
ncbi:CrcB family protein [Jeotgalibacillus sp. R-1-5s-1]|uniref:fluoride efflux transporter FluC n=1 Tax=Jeotgalibacillus sp. R-1-5s-1 TaxID=2555897 RepID=UPI00106B38CD|nr:CrcB family protein [Jeotgalibacillus sp. R-1-5s-1]TFE00108.1 CrcB family protein [Jeotgalibacillus sp. R-1-5s-1]